MRDKPPPFHFTHLMHRPFGEMAELDGAALLSSAKKRIRAESESGTLQEFVDYVEQLRATIAFWGRKRWRVENQSEPPTITCQEIELLLARYDSSLSDEDLDYRLWEAFCIFWVSHEPKVERAITAINQAYQLHQSSSSSGFCGKQDSPTPSLKLGGDAFTTYLVLLCYAIDEYDRDMFDDHPGRKALSGIGALAQRLEEAGFKMKEGGKEIDGVVLCPIEWNGYSLNAMHFAQPRSMMKLLQENIRKYAPDLHRTDKKMDKEADRAALDSHEDTQQFIEAARRLVFYNWGNFSPGFARPLVR